MLQDSQAANQFIDKIIEEKNLQDLDAEVHKQLHNDLMRRLEDRINHAIINSLNNKQATQLEHLIDTQQIDKIQSFLKKEGINVNGIIAGTMSKFYSDYLGA